MNIGDLRTLLKKGNFSDAQEIQILDKEGNQSPAEFIFSLKGSYSRYSPIVLGVSKVCQMCGENFVVSAVGNPNICKECGERLNF